MVIKEYVVKGIVFPRRERREGVKSGDSSTTDDSWVIYQMTLFEHLARQQIQLEREKHRELESQLQNLSPTLVFFSVLYEKASQRLTVAKKRRPDDSNEALFLVDESQTKIDVDMVASLRGHLKLLNDLPYAVFSGSSLEDLEISIKAGQSNELESLLHTTAENMLVISTKALLSLSRLRSGSYDEETLARVKVNLEKLYQMIPRFFATPLSSWYNITPVTKRESFSGERYGQKEALIDIYGVVGYRMIEQIIADLKQGEPFTIVLIWKYALHVL